MRIDRIEDLHCDAGWRNFSFLKITTDDGLVGWSEYTEADGSPGLTGVIRALGQLLIGRDPRPVQQISSELYQRSVMAASGVNHRAIAAIENALLDIKARALGVPVYALLGGPVRDRIPVYWSHCGTYRARHPQIVGAKQLENYDDVAKLGEEVRARGFRALKTNILPPKDGKLSSFTPGFGRSPGYPALNLDRHVLQATQRQLQAFRDGAGPDMGLLLDVNFHFKTEGFIQIARAMAPFDMTWLEIDTLDPRALALIRAASPCPIASCETLTGRRAFRPFLDAYAMDVGIIDVVWNGFLESVKIAAMAEAYEVNVAPHNYYGHLCSAMSAHFCAAVPNLRIMEIDVDSAAWRDDLFTNVPEIRDGEMLVPSGPGWGVAVNEEAVRAHPPRR
ncbi:MAG: mandelate racemase/muconate lactonizing enzyme family protein [Alphaproteobacteria bacterium]|nr:mandelate racemase/muconate lactonizing enzyme family protein [Alphaproteobacteria bacterium]